MNQCTVNPTTKGPLFHHIKYYIEYIQIVSEWWLPFNAELGIFQLYHGEFQLYHGEFQLYHGEFQLYHDEFQLYHGEFQLYHGEFQLYHGEFQLYHGEFQLYHGEFQLYHGEFQLYHGEFQLYHGEFQLYHGEFQLYHGEFQLYHGEFQLYHGEFQLYHGEFQLYHGEFQLYHGEFQLYHGEFQLYHGEFQLLFNIMIMPYFVLEEAVVVDHIASRFTTTCAISAYLYTSCEFESRSWPGAFDTTLCDKVCQRFATDRWFSPGTLVSSTNKTDGHDITEILLKVALNTILLTLTFKCVLYPGDRHV